MALRFRVGSLVICKVQTVQGERLMRGTVAKLNYREGWWPIGRIAAYQVELDNGDMIFAPTDTDSIIREDDGGDLQGE
jgi:hypothetical protein